MIYTYKKYDNDMTYCFCRYCKGKIVSIWVDHYKLFNKYGDEYYLHINNKLKEIEITQKM